MKGKTINYPKAILWIQILELALLLPGVVIYQVSGYAAEWIYIDTQSYPNPYPFGLIVLIFYDMQVALLVGILVLSFPFLFSNLGERGVEGDPGKGARLADRMTVLFFFSMILALARASLSHESYHNVYGEGIYRDAATVHELMQPGLFMAILICAVFIFSPFGKGPQILRNENGLAPGPERLILPCDRGVLVSGLLHYLSWILGIATVPGLIFLFISLNQQFHDESPSNITRLIEIMVASVVFFHAAKVLTGQAGSEAKRDFASMVRLLLFAEIYRNLSKQEIFIGFWTSIRFYVNESPEFLLHPAGRIWNLNVLILLLILQILGGIVLFRTATGCFDLKKINKREIKEDGWQGNMGRWILRVLKKIFTVPVTYSLSQASMACFALAPYLASSDSCPKGLSGALSLLFRFFGGMELVMTGALFLTSAHALAVVVGITKEAETVEPSKYLKRVLVYFVLLCSVALGRLVLFLQTAP